MIEDDLDMQTLIIDYLENYGFKVEAYDDPKDALSHFQQNKQTYLLLVLDLMLPQIDGFDVCKKIREVSNIPIIISSARSEMSDKILGFDFGADDYLAKPYEPRELVLRINSILRRTAPKNKQIGDFEIDEGKMEIKVEGLLLDLTKIEFLHSGFPTQLSFFPVQSNPTDLFHPQKNQQCQHHEFFSKTHSELNDQYPLLEMVPDQLHLRQGSTSGYLSDERYQTHLAPDQPRLHEEFFLSALLASSRHNLSDLN
ncbi:MAG: response regulator transcription factor [Sulfurimonas sp.]